MKKKSTPPSETTFAKNFQSVYYQVTTDEFSDSTLFVISEVSFWNRQVSDYDSWKFKTIQK